MTDNKIKAQVIINPISGVGSKRKIPSLIESIIDKDKYDLTVSYTEYKGHAAELTEKALNDGALLIIAVGGDGTVNEVASSMICTNAVLGIIPKGSGNGLARELHIPIMDVKRAINLISKGYVSTIDVCKANNKVFFCTCGVGFDAEVSRKFANEKYRGSFTYIKNTIMEYLSYKPEPYELIIDNQTIKEKAFLVACANASQYGNNAFIAPGADLRDGKMDITILSPFTPLDVAPLAIQLFTKQINRNSNIKTFKAHQLSIIRQQPGAMHLDGDLVMTDSRIDISIIPHSLKVITPEESSFKSEVKNLFEEFSQFFNNKLSYLFKL